MNQKSNPPQFKTISGRWVVIALLGFGVAATGTLWVYSKMQLAPFVPLLKALRTEFPESKAHVEGGRHRREPPKLRVVMQVEFTPTETDERIQKIFARVVALAKADLDLSQYENFELHIMHYIPEKNPERILIQRKIAEL
jgi:hypothetical protein